VDENGKPSDLAELDALDRDRLRLIDEDAIAGREPGEGNIVRRQARSKFTRRPVSFDRKIAQSHPVSADHDRGAALKIRSHTERAPGGVAGQIGIDRHFGVKLGNAGRKAHHPARRSGPHERHGEGDHRQPRDDAHGLNDLYPDRGKGAAA
jgi:hypothetical protein